MSLIYTYLIFKIYTYTVYCFNDLYFFLQTYNFSIILYSKTNFLNLIINLIMKHVAVRPHPLGRFFKFSARYLLAIFKSRVMNRYEIFIF